MDTLHLEHVEDLIDGGGRVDFIRPLQPKDNRRHQRGRPHAVKTDIENRLVVAKREGEGEGWSGSLGGGMNWEIGIDIYTLLIPCIK